MATKTNIEWTDFNWNFLRGCRRVSEGCTNCYAEAIAARFSGFHSNGKKLPYFGLAQMVNGQPRWTGEISFDEKALLAPLKRKTPTKYFVNSMSDLFYERVTDEMIDKAFAVMALCPQHTFQILTKRPERMKAHLTERTIDPFAVRWVLDQGKTVFGVKKFSQRMDELLSWAKGREVAPNIWLGVSVEDQATADERIPLLLDTPAAVRWISAEPLLSAIDLDWRINVPGGYVSSYLSGHHADRGETDENGRAMFDGRTWYGNKLDWIVVGGESGPRARPCDISHIRSIVEQCKAAGVPVFCKQLGANVRWDGLQGGYGDGASNCWPEGTLKVDVNHGWRMLLKDRKGGSPEEWPIDLRVRQFPEVANV